MRTSKLTLKSFVEEAEDGGVFVKAKSEIDRNREVVDVKSFLRIIFDSLRTAKSNVLLRYDLKRKMVNEILNCARNSNLMLIMIQENGRRSTSLPCI